MEENHSFLDNIHDQFHFDIFNFSNPHPQEDDASNDSLENDSSRESPTEEISTKPSPKQTISRKKRKLYAHNPYYAPSLRILKSDIRRSYMAMYFNVMNSANPQLILSYFKKFYRPDCQWIVNLADNFYPNHIKSIGIENILVSFADIFDRMPDFLMHSSDVSIFVSYDTSKSHIVCKCKVSGTKMYTLSVPEALTYNQLGFPTSKEYLSYTNPSKYNQSLTKHQLPTPLFLSLAGKFTMTLDENYNIYSLESTFDDCQESLASLSLYDSILHPISNQVTELSSDEL